MMANEELLKVLKEALTQLEEFHKYSEDAEKTLEKMGIKSERHKKLTQCLYRVKKAIDEVDGEEKNVTG